MDLFCFDLQTAVLLSCHSPEERSPQMAQMCFVSDRAMPEGLAGTFITPLRPSGGLMSSELLTEFIGEFSWNINTQTHTLTGQRAALWTWKWKRPLIRISWYWSCNERPGYWCVFGNSYDNFVNTKCKKCFLLEYSLVYCRGRGGFNPRGRN